MRVILNRTQWSEESSLHPSFKLSLRPESDAAAYGGFFTPLCYVQNDTPFISTYGSDGLGNSAKRSDYYLM